MSERKDLTKKPLIKWLVMLSHVLFLVSVPLALIGSVLGNFLMILLPTVYLSIFCLWLWPSQLAYLAFKVSSNRKKKE